MGLFGRSRIPARLSALLRPDELVLAVARLTGGGNLAATRYGLWVVPADAGAGAVVEPPTRIDWATVSKVRWQSPTLELTGSDVVGRLGDADLIVDRPPVRYELAAASRVTDIVHDRVRRAIVRSEHVTFPAGGCWLVLRRVAGRDGLVGQVRLDRGTPPDGLEDLVDDWLRRAASAE